MTVSQETVAWDKHIAAAFLERETCRQDYVARKRRVADHFLAWLHSESLSLASVKTAHLNQYMVKLVAQGTAFPYVTQVIRGILAIVHDGKPRADNPGAGWRFKIPKAAEDHVFSVSQLADIFHMAHNLAAQASGRRRCTLLKQLAIAELVYSTGMSVADVNGLKIQSLQTAEEGYIEVDGRNGARMVPVTKRAHNALRRWLTSTGELGQGQGGFLFYGVASRQPDSIHVTKMSTTNLGLSLGLKGEVGLTFGNLQASYVAHLLNAGANPQLLAYTMGYEKLNSMQRHVANAKRILDAS